LHENFYGLFFSVFVFVNFGFQFSFSFFGLWGVLFFLYLFAIFIYFFGVIFLFVFVFFVGFLFLSVFVYFLCFLCVWGLFFFRGGFFSFFFFYCFLNLTCKQPYDSWRLGHVVPDDVVIADIGDQALDTVQSTHKNGIVKTFTQKNPQLTRHDAFV